MSKTDIKIKKYNAIKLQLIEDIDNGIYPPGSQLPSETQLIEKFQASRITIRRAIDELVNYGYIEKHQGKKSYIKKKPETQELTTVSSYTEEILRKGMIPSRKLIFKEIRICTESEQELLNLDKATPVFYMERIIYANNTPLCYTTTTLPYTIFRDIEFYDFENNSLYDTIENKFNIPIDSSNLKLKAVPANTTISNYLNIEKNTPLLFSSAVTYGRVNNCVIPIEHFKTYYVTTVFEYTLTQKR